MFNWSLQTALAEYLATIEPVPTGASMKFNGWDVSIVTPNQEDYTVVLVKGSEIQFLLPEGGDAIALDDMRKFLPAIHGQHGFVTSRVRLGNPVDHLEALGFVQTWSDEQFSYFSLSGMPEEARPAGAESVNQAKHAGLPQFSNFHGLLH